MRDSLWAWQPAAGEATRAADTGPDTSMTDQDHHITLLQPQQNNIESQDGSWWQNTMENPH